MIPVNKTTELNELFQNKDLKIHYYCDEFVLASTDAANVKNAIILDENAFEGMGLYAIVNCSKDMRNEYLAKSSETAMSLYADDEFLIMKILSPNFYPAKNDGMVMISQDMKARLNQTRTYFPTITEQDDTILSFLEEISIDRMMTVVQRMVDFETRYCQHDSSYAAHNWIKAQYEALGLEVYSHDFPLYGSNDNSSDNVIAIQYGAEFPDEYIVCGCHMDSYNYYSQNVAPGADDNATGVAGILEAARILSQHTFARSIIYCSFSAEELGLVGSGYYAQKCASEGMNILGYFNIDMSGYLAASSDIHIHMIFPDAALPLANYYMNVCEVYLPTVPVERRNFTAGNSDHTSFNNNGYMGIFPFEDVQAYSPYIHTYDDLIGNSLNNQEQMKVFTMATLASIAILADCDDVPQLPNNPPTNCLATGGHNFTFQITWDAPTENTPDGYNVYRNEIKINTEIVTDLIYTDVVESYDNFCYNITAVYGDEESDFSNESCLIALGIENTNSKYSIYPNPANDKVFIKGKNANLPIMIYDLKGQLLIESLTGTTVTEINISNLSKGAYLIKVDDEVVGKFVKE